MGTQVCPCASVVHFTCSGTMAEPAQKKAKTERVFLFSSESVNEGHPDKVCDQVSDAVLDACLTADPKSKVACETATKDNMVMVAGEITTQTKIDYEQDRLRDCHQGQHGDDRRRNHDPNQDRLRE